MSLELPLGRINNHNPPTDAGCAATEQIVYRVCDSIIPNPHSLTILPYGK